MTDQIIKKKRIFQIAKELNISHVDIMDFLARRGATATSHMSPVEPEIYERILDEFAKEKVIVDRYRKEKVRRDIALARRQEAGRFEQILTPEEQRSIEAAEQETQKERQFEAQRLRDEEELKRLALEELKREAEEATAGVEEQVAPRAEVVPGAIGPEAGGKPAPPPVQRTKLKRINIRDIESKITQGRRQPAARKRKEAAKDGKPLTVEKTLRQTLATLSQGEKKRKPARKGKELAEETTETAETRPVIKIHEFMSVEELARTMNMNAMDVIRTCMEVGIMATINQRLDLESLSIVADELGFNIEAGDVLSDDTLLEQLASRVEAAEKVKRPAIVTVMGHVDHGKTSLLDYIRESNVVAGESGGITQHIGAYEVKLPDGQRITFLDTPGHEAFTAMRARGTQITDVVVLVVAADDAVMPQTLEALNHAKAASVSIVVAINKMDKPEADSERVKRQLSEEGILVEDWGGKYQCAEISAKTGQGVEGLLEKILLEAEVLDLTAVTDAPAVGTIIESRLDKGLGPVATVLLESGTLRQGDAFLCGKQFGRVRAMHNERGSKMKEMLPADPVQILGFDVVPQAGDKFIVFEDEREAKRISSERMRVKREIERRQFRVVGTLDEVSRQIREGTVKELALLIKADVDGSAEALADSFHEFDNSEVRVEIIHRGVGMVSENDVLLAMASHAIIIAFRVNVAPGAKLLARNDQVEIRRYDVIYEAVNEMKLALEGLLEPEQVEAPVGLAEVRETFRSPELGVIAGCYIKEGKAIRNALLRVKRNGEVLHSGALTSLRRFKDDVREVQEGFECGIGIEGFKEFEVDDILEFYEIKEVKRTLA